MLGRVWLLGSRGICPFSSPTARRAGKGSAWLTQAGRDFPLCTDPSQDPALLLSAPRDGEDTRAERLSQRPADTVLGNLIYSYKKGLWSL